VAVHARAAGAGARVRDSLRRFQSRVGRRGRLGAAVLGVSGVFGMLYPARPWLWALAVGTWIPAFGIVTEFNYASLLALMFPLAGAYAGAVVAGRSSPSGDPG
jgi:hypothetical protein